MMNNIVLTLCDYLHQISSANDHSIARLISSLEKRRGLNGIELLDQPSLPISLSIQHNSSIITGQQISEIVQVIADNLNKIFGHLLFKNRDNSNLDKVSEFFQQCSGVTNVLAKPNGWIDLEFNRYITQETQLIKCINQYS